MYEKNMYLSVRIYVELYKSWNWIVEVTLQLPFLLHLWVFLYIGACEDSRCLSLALFTLVPGDSLSLKPSSAGDQQALALSPN